MKRALMSAGGLLLLTSVLYAQNPVATFEQVAVNANTGGVGFTASKITPDSPSGNMMTLATCRVESNSVRFRFDGTAATSQIGTIANVGDVFYISGHDAMVLFKAISQNAASSELLDCSYTP